MNSCFVPIRVVKHNYSPSKSIIYSLTVNYYNILSGLGVVLEEHEMDYLPVNTQLNDDYDNDSSNKFSIKRGMNINGYDVIGFLGSGSFGHVVSGKDQQGNLVAIKFVRNDPDYFRKGLFEIAILRLLEKWNAPHTVRCVSHFMYEGHLCIVFELLKSTIYKYLSQRGKGVGVGKTRNVLSQLLLSLTTMANAGVVHCDVKPENIMFTNDQLTSLKLIDVGSSCFFGENFQQYIQSRYYRAPEVILGFAYDSAIDMWSVGCIAVELLFGIPIFPGNSEYNQLEKIIEVIGMPPTSFLEQAPNVNKFFNKRDRTISGIKKTIYEFKTKAQFDNENGFKTPKNVRYHEFKSLKDISLRIPFPVVSADQRRKPELRAAFLHFLEKTLCWKPENRMLPDQALQHPFITKEPFQIRQYTLPKTTISKATIQRISNLDMIDIFMDGDLRVLEKDCSNEDYYNIFIKTLDSFVVPDFRYSNPFIVPPFVLNIPTNEIDKASKVLDYLDKSRLPKDEEVESVTSSIYTGEAIVKCDKPELQLQKKLKFMQPTRIQRVKTVEDIENVAGKQVNPKQLKKTDLKKDGSFQLNPEHTHQSFLNTSNSYSSYNSPRGSDAKHYNPLISKHVISDGRYVHVASLPPHLRHSRSKSSTKSNYCATIK